MLKKTIYQVELLLERSNALYVPRIILIVGALVSIVWAIYFSVVTMTIRYQIELREGTALVLTRLLLSGKNPFSFEYQPLAMTNYGIGYNIAVLPFAAMFGSTLLVHRAVTFVFILLSALVCFVVVNDKKKDVSLALVCSAFVIVALVGQGGIGAFPSAMGTFLFLLIVLMPYIRSFDRTSLIVSILGSLLAFYTKPYFILAFGIVVAYLFVFVSKKKAAYFGGLFLVLFFISFLFIRFIFPLYFIDTLVGNLSNTTRSVEHLRKQLMQLLYYFYPVLGVALIVFVKTLKIKKPGMLLEYAVRKKGDIFDWNLPFSRYSVNYLLFSFVISFLAFTFILGLHVGNYMNYAYQLLIPLFFCWFLQALDINSRLWVFVGLLIVFNLFMWELKILNFSMLAQKDSKEWAELYEYVALSKNALNSTVITSEILELGMTPVDAGQSLVYYTVKPYADINLVGPSFSSWYENGVMYTKSIDQLIRNKKFDLVIATLEKATFYHARFLEENYFLIDEIKVDMPQTGQSWTMLVWRPLAK
ncbi:MAG: hypothetical protein K8S20_05475 [Chloroflexi bacterium]|nr:hypothetical protein [Chloroflexota bacterium]